MASYFFVKSHGVEWRDATNSVLGSGEFGEVVNNLEVRDDQKIVDLIKTIVADRKVGKVYIVLDDSVVFAKNLSMSDSLNADLESLWTEIPIHPDMVGKKVLITSRGVLALATNSFLYRSMIKAIEKVGGEVDMVVAKSAMEFLPKYDLDKLNFFGEEVVDTRSAVRRSYVKILTIILILSIFGTGFYSGWKYRVWDRNKENIKPVPTVGVQPTSQVDVSPTPEAKNKDLRFMVLNATETTGLAGQVKELLAADGYVEVEIGTLNESVASQSSVLVSEGVQQADRDHLLELLEKMLGTLKIEEASESAEIDVVITINKSF